MGLNILVTDSIGHDAPAHELAWMVSYVPRLKYRIPSLKEQLYMIEEVAPKALYEHTGRPVYKGSSSTNMRLLNVKSSPMANMICSVIWAPTVSELDVIVANKAR